MTKIAGGIRSFHPIWRG